LVPAEPNKNYDQSLNKYDIFDLFGWFPQMRVCYEKYLIQHIHVYIYKYVDIKDVCEDNKYDKSL
jgi:hypothetical protein